MPGFVGSIGVSKAANELRLGQIGAGTAFKRFQGSLASLCRFYNELRPGQRRWLQTPRRPFQGSLAFLSSRFYRRFKGGK